MLGKDLSEALGGIADDKIEAAANMAPAHRRSTWVRVAACAAVLAILIGAMLFWPGSPQVVENPTGGTQVVVRPLFGIQVYAAEGLRYVSEATDEPIFAGEPIEDELIEDNSNPFGVPMDGRAYRYNTVTGEWEPLFANKRLPKFDLVIWVEEGWEELEADLVVYQNGKKVDLWDRESPNFRRFLAMNREGQTGWSLSCSFQEVVTLEILVESKKTGEILLKQVIKVTPAVFEKEEATVAPDGSTVMQVFMNEGYMLEILDEYRIE